MRSTLFLLSVLTGFLTGLTRADNSVREVAVADHLENFLQEFEDYRITNRISAKLDQLLNVIKSGDVKITLDEMPHAKNPKLCLTCLSASHTFLQIYKQAQIKEKNTLIKLAQDICHLYSLKPYVCDGLIELNADMILYMLEHLEVLPTARRVCEIAYQGEDCVVSGSDILADRYPKVNVSLSDKVLKSSKKSSSHSNQDPLVIVHLTDIHFDPDYVVGVNAECGSEACCRPVPGLVQADSTNAAGFWGDYRDCDTPWHGVVNVVNQIRTQHPKIDAIYFTGDIIHHFTWNTTLETNEESMRRVFQLLKQTFAGIPLYPILGNHEAHPANLYAPHDIPEVLNSKYLYDYIANEWEEWLRNESVNTTLADGGYYTVLSPLGHRIIALNNNFCFSHNWWLMFSDNYFLQQLQWLHDTLLAAESAGEKVHILAHVPSYDNYCYVGWTREYRKIVERFAHIIEGQFNGHSHVDEFNVYYRKDDPSVAVSVAWNGGSTTTFTRLNPNYKIFYVERDNFEILDHETWFYNLTEANQHPDRNPLWTKEYSFKEQFNLADLSPVSLDGLLQKFAHTEAELLQFWKLKQKQADPMLASGCDRVCLRETLCTIVRTEYGDDAACSRLLAARSHTDLK
ncbi:sphingomyelin phosphodiesterase 1-like [Topomyia yanbarensis]|uniref:sphingomyelin phosphodiesterase 1-like n=1 Tax=Topomyia yanbarensis TaxID=2498891 RepID=UPI00273BBBDC|nr:sphingomyelin phosphodiesterase 1-like [Topomyia yanbarensis]